MDAETLEAEAAEAGLLPASRRKLSSGETEADSVVVILQVPE